MSPYTCNFTLLPVSASCHVMSVPDDLFLENSIEFCIKSYYDTYLKLPLRHLLPRKEYGDKSFLEYCG